MIRDIAMWLELDERMVRSLMDENDHYTASHIKGLSTAAFTVRAKAFGAGHRWVS